MIGAMSFSTVAQACGGVLVLEGHWWLLGLLWAPALVAASLLARGGRVTPPTFRPAPA